MSRRGHDRERGLKGFLEELHWVCVRAAGSLGPVDVVALATRASIYPKAMRELLELPDRPQVGETLLIECKSTLTPYAHFGPADRQDMLTIADSVGARAWLAWKPKFASRWSWIPSCEWPAPAGSPGPALADYRGKRNGNDSENLPKIPAQGGSGQVLRDGLETT